MPRPVIIVPYDPNWPRIYEEESKLVMGAVGMIIRSLEHIGSTSVLGLWAKHIIDIIAGVDSREMQSNPSQRRIRRCITR